MKRIHCTYHVLSSAAEIKAGARAMAVEQTVEVIEALFTPEINENIVGRVESVKPLDEEQTRWEVQISFADHLSGGHLPQLLNLVIGNSTMHSGIRLVDMELPDTVLSRFPGPQFGIAGVRRLIGVYGRPLLASVVKPYGTPTEAFEKIVYEFALGGGDLIKDDQNLFDVDYDAFCRRAVRLRDAVDRANDKTGRRCLYFPYIGGQFAETERRLDFLLENRITGYLIAPLLMGIEATRHLIADRPLVAMGHPSLAGVVFTSTDEGISKDVYLGTIYRLMGIDISIFVNAHGRFSFTREQCRKIVNRLRRPLGDLAPVLPCPAGGMRFDNIEQMSEDYGEDACLLIGGALLGYSDDVEASTRAFLEEVRQRFDEKTVAPEG